jgi:asparagine synthase (glutamine-hydrolysing)
MCGIVGVMTTALSRVEERERLVESMNRCIAHRGPDDSGMWSEPTASVTLGFRRLAIIDLTEAGHQPMKSASGRFTIVFNGEVFNYVEIREELERDGARFRGHSDTEVILASFEHWGIEASVPKFVGMFAIAVWDEKLRRLSLIRDRLGIKPVYYAYRKGHLTFGSELKAIVADPSFERTIDQDALSAYLRYLYVPAPLTIFKGVRKLMPGHILTIENVDAPLPAEEAYWSANDVYAAAQANAFDGSDVEVVAELHRLLKDAVRLRMRSDVPMGALLSGGIDSSTVVGLMQEIATQPTRTFSIGFPGTAHDETAHAASIARALGTNHTELAVTGEDALNVVPMLPDLFDEPFADPSQIPTYLVCKLARRDVTVALSGDGGDEVWTGYERYIQGERIIGKLRNVPGAVRKFASAGIRTSNAQFWDRAYKTVAPIIDAGGRHRLAGEKIRKLGNLLSENSEGGMYRTLLSAGWQDPSSVMAHPTDATTRIEQLLAQKESIPLLDRMMLVDQQTYLADDLLAKVDRASMAVSLEARVPLLDHRVVEFGWRVDRRFKVRDGRGKWALRQVLYKLIDPELVDRPKTGFSVPIAEWLRGPLRQYAEDLLFSSRGEQWLSTSQLRDTWSAFQKGADEYAFSLWAAVMFQAWKARWIA